MNKITEFTKPSLKVLRVELNEALATVGEKLGIKIEAGNISFSDNQADIKVAANLISETGRVMTKEAEAWNQYRNLFELSHLSIGDEITLNREQFTLEGYNSRASRMPVQVKSVTTGKRYKFPLESLDKFKKEEAK